MDCSTPGFPVHQQPSEPFQTHVHRIGDAMQPSHPLSSASPEFNLAQHQGLFQFQFFRSGGQSIGVSASASLLLLTGILFSRSGVWMVSFSLKTANGVHRPRALLEADESFLAFLSLIQMCSRKLCLHRVDQLLCIPFCSLEALSEQPLECFSRTGAEKGGRQQEGIGRLFGRCLLGRRSMTHVT